MTVSHIMADYVPAGTRLVGTDSDQELERYHQLLETILPMHTIGTPVARDDIYDLEMINQEWWPFGGNVPMYQVAAMFRCHATRYHPEYLLYLVVQHYGDGRRHDVQFLAALDGEAIDLSQSRTMDVTLYCSEVEDHLNRVLSEIYPLVLIEMVRRGIRVVGGK
jgi:hypothetical protein